ncbi:EF_hand_5 domain-containing protein [Cephalotus follicularis]|uniref:EF_hand_5 domain-containing protein n=1 Tax=Cephalotus follicularis TaxID=3775 RepID=A0A1Q3B209_CEPFO|nr:EF_hand_5 domain-containing protein [Cephalotus follicularis]
MGNSEAEEEETPDNSNTEDDDDDDVCKSKKQHQPISDYEKQRLSRIAQNRARMEALGLPKIASSLMGSAQSKSSDRKGKRKVISDDEDYRPNDDHDHDFDGNDDDDDDDFLGNEGSRSRNKKVKKKSPKPKKKGAVQRRLSSSDYIDGGDDDELMQAIALSLQDSAQVSGGVSKIRGKARAQEDTGRRKRKNSITSRVQMTEDEVVLHFFQFDEAGAGSITVRDLRRVAIAHDFIWTDKELADMIHCFDTNSDGKLSLDDFRKIVGRCKMTYGT